MQGFFLYNRIFILTPISQNMKDIPQAHGHFTKNICNCKWLRLEGNGWPGFPEVTTKGYSCWHMLGRHRGSSLIPRGSSPAQAPKPTQGPQNSQGGHANEGMPSVLLTLTQFSFVYTALLHSNSIYVGACPGKYSQLKIILIFLTKSPLPKIGNFDMLKAVTLSLKMTTSLGCCT